MNINFSVKVLKSCTLRIQLLLFHTSTDAVTNIAGQPYGVNRCICLKSKHRHKMHGMLYALEF